MSGIVLPDGREVVNAGEEGVVDVGDLLLAIARNTAAMGRLLDILVRLECGATKRAELKADILATEQAIREMQENEGIDMQAVQQSLDDAIKAGD